jgi:hypothetical protein
MGVAAIIWCRLWCGGVWPAASSRQLAAGGSLQVEFELISVFNRRKTNQYFFVSGSSK